MGFSLEKDFLSETPQGVVLNIKVLPCSSKNVIADLQDNYLRIKITSAPVKGKANKECQRLLADFFKIKKSQVVFQKGMTTRIKQVLLEGMTKEAVIRKIRNDRADPMGK